MSPNRLERKQSNISIIKATMLFGFLMCLGMYYLAMSIMDMNI